MKKSLVKIASASAVVLMLAGCSTTGAQNGSATNKADKSETIATIGKEKISFDDYYSELKKQAGAATLRSMIIQRVLEQKVADKDALKKSAESEVDQQIKSAGGEAVFAKLLAFKKLGSIEDFRRSVYVRNLFQEVIEKNVDTSEDAIKKFYESGYKPVMEAQHILVEKEDEAKNIIKRLNDGEDFEKLAKELSKDGSGKNGGKLGEFTSGKMVKEFEDAVKSVGNGELVAKPVKSKYGWHVIRTIKNGEKLPYGEVKDAVKKQYLESKFNDSAVAYSVVGKLIKEVGVEVNDQELKPVLDDLMAAIKNAEEKVKKSETETTTTAEKETTAAPAEKETTASEETTEAAKEETTVEETTAE
ncbi:peptidylprolyl isomerase [Aerococcaceae bacterium zg-BR9]|uniref:peptidylprolyl isomerase n=1 Tax=Aerococcaceae bacterium zg-1292 TaxID=2774330 RepID=UPI0040631C31|nr:peptidylprolyl isomerase [Aerococcaceae bacterium zg-BR9]